MIAVTQIGGHQAIVQKGDTLSVDKLDLEEGKTVEFPVLLVSDEDGKNFQLGAPLLEGVTVKAKVLGQYKDEKIVVFKHKPRKRYTRTRGHRTHLTKIEITEIKVGSTKSQAPSTKKKEEAPKKEAKPKAAAKKPAAKKTTKKAEKKAE